MLQTTINYMISFKFSNFYLLYSPSKIDGNLAIPITLVVVLKSYRNWQGVELFSFSVSLYLEADIRTWIRNTGI